MNTIELFAGTGSFSKVARLLEHQTFTTDYEEIDGQDLVADIRDLTTTDFPYRPDILWASPPCEGFSVAAIGKNWNHDNTPKTDSARRSVELVQHTVRLIKELQPTWWFIENPRGKLRKLDLIDAPFMHTVTYCQYGDTRMKPTDIWTNAHWWTPRPVCKNGMPCHVAAPRGSSTGTQGIKGYKDRSRIPAALFEEILSQM
jgi:hypothetical protein